MTQRNEDRKNLKGKAAIQGIREGLAEVLEKFREVTETGEAKGEGEFKDSKTGETRGIYGFSIKMGLGDDKDQEVVPFGNIRVDAETGETGIQALREPLIEMSDLEDHLLIVAEMPGISDDDVKLELQQDKLLIEAQRETKKYRKEIQLPRPCQRQQIQFSCHHGVLKIICQNK